MAKLEKLAYELLRLFVVIGRWLLVSKVRFLIVIAAVFIIGISFKQIPKTIIAGHSWGIDFYNLYAYHHCENFKNFPYKDSGEHCLDSRGMIYPPLMYWFYSWVRGLSFSMTYTILISVIVVGVLVSGLALPGEQHRNKYWWFFPFLLMQFPSAFSIERGNNDIFIVLLWLGLMTAWYYKQVGLAGFIAAIALQAKVYPIIPIGLLGLCWLTLWFKKNLNDKEQELRQKLNLFILGLLIGSIALFVLLWEQSVYYWTHVFPQWAKQGQGRAATVHSIYSIIPGFLPMAALAGGVLGFSWLRATCNFILKDPVLILSGLLAISTYFQGVSNDYNLITVYPLTALLFIRAFRNEGSKQEHYAGLIPFGCFVGFGYKWFWQNQMMNISGIHIALQVIWLSIIAYLPSFEHYLKQNKNHSIVRY